VSGTSAFFRGLSRAAQRPALTLLLSATSALAVGLFALPLYLLLGRSMGSQPEAAELLRGSLGPLSNALEGHFYELLSPLAVAAFLLQALLRTFIAGGLFARLHPQGGNLADSFFGLCARHFPTFVIQAILNGIFLILLLIVSAILVKWPAGQLGDVETPRSALLIRLAIAALFWVALSLAARALDIGRAHIINRGGHRPIEGFFTGIKQVLSHPLGALALSLWAAVFQLCLVALWLAADWKLHIHGGLSWLLALLLYALYLLATSFLRVTVAAGAFELVSKNG
jgi:hypothetical protein